MFGFKSYQSHLSLALHFNNKGYDCLKYNFKTNAKEESFNKNNMRWQFGGLEKKYEIKHIRMLMFLAFEKNDFNYTSPMKLFQIMNKLKKEEKDFVYNIFVNDLLYLKEVYNSSPLLFNTEDLYPNIYIEYINKKINIKTLLLLSLFIKDIINSESSRDVIAWPRFVDHANNLIPLVKYFYNKKEVESAFVSNYLN